MKAEAPQAETPRPRRRQCVGGGGRGQPGVERGVEAGDRGHCGQRDTDRLDPGQCTGLVQRGQVGQRADPGHHVVVDRRGRSEPVPAVHDPVPGRADAGQPAQECPQAGVVRTAVPGGQVRRRHHLIRRGEHAQLEAARPGVDHQDAGH